MLLKSLDSHLAVALAFEQLLATHLLERIAAVARVTKGFQIGDIAVCRNVVQVGHHHYPAPRECLKVSHYGALVGVVGGVNALAKLFDRFPSANAGPPAELAVPVNLGVDPTGDAFQLGGYSLRSIGMTLVSPGSIRLRIGEILQPLKGL